MWLCVSHCNMHVQISCTGINSTLHQIPLQDDKMECYLILSKTKHIDSSTCMLSHHHILKVNFGYHTFYTWHMWFHACMYANHTYTVTTCYNVISDISILEFKPNTCVQCVHWADQSFQSRRSTNWAIDAGSLHFMTKLLETGLSRIKSLLCEYG